MSILFISPENKPAKRLELFGFPAHGRMNVFIDSLSDCTCLSLSLESDVSPSDTTMAEFRWGWLDSRDQLLTSPLFRDTAPCSVSI